MLPLPGGIARVPQFSHGTVAAMIIAWSAWSGEPGMMFWMNKGSYWGAGILAFIWVLFRLVGPALGLYQLN